MFVELSDGTKVPKHYDFNDYFPPLPMHNQGTNPICWYETRATMIEAFMRMYDKVNVHLNPESLSHSDQGWALSHWTDLRPNGFGALGTMTYVGGDVLTNLPEYKDLPMIEAVAKALWTNGVLEGSVFAQQSFGRMWKHPSRYSEWWNEHTHKFDHIPVLHTLNGDLNAVDKNTWAHLSIYVGYKLVMLGDLIKGIEILVQNSWGKNFGKDGRCYIGHDLVEAGAARAGFIHSWNEHPANGLKMPEKRVA